MLRLAWNNGKLLTQAWLLNGALRSLWRHSFVVPRAEQSWHSKPNVIYGNSLGQNTSRVAHTNWRHINLSQQVSLCLCFNAIRAITVTEVRGKWQCSMYFHEKHGRDNRFSEICAAQFSGEMSRICEFRVIMRIMTRLLVHCLWSTLVLRANDWLRQNPRCALVMTASFTLSPRVLHEQRPRSPGHYPLS